jgi:small redox-active disulfide protein 2
MVRIEVMGTGCPKCWRVLATVHIAVKELGIEAEVIKVDNIDAIVNRGVMLTPALFIDGQLRAEGRIPCVDEIKEMIMGQRLGRGESLDEKEPSKDVTGYHG